MSTNEEVRDLTNERFNESCLSVDISRFKINQKVREENNCVYGHNDFVDQTIASITWNYLRPYISVYITNKAIEKKNSDSD